MSDARKKSPQDFSLLNEGRDLARLVNRPLSGISAVAVFVILAVLIQAYAGMSLRGLYADGAYHVNQILARHDFFLHPGRPVSLIIDQFPVLAAIRLGLETPHGVALAFSLTTNLLPGLIILLCLPALPTGERRFFIFPAFVYFAGTLSAQFASVVEDLVATSYFWLLLILIAFGRLTILRVSMIAVLAVASLRLHESMLFLGPLLVASCIMRLRYEKDLLPRIVLSAVALCELVSAGIAAASVLYPDSVGDRDRFVAGFLGLHWIYASGNGGGWNLPCVLAMLAVSCIVAIMYRPAWGPAMSWIFAGISLPLALATFWVDWLVAPGAQFGARHNPALISVPVAALLMGACASPLAVNLTTGPVRRVVVLLGIAVALWHLSATEKWSIYLTHFSNVLQSRAGVIAWEAVVTPPGSREAKLATMMMWDWTNPDLSLNAVPRRCVNSVIDNPPGISWQPYVVSNIATMPAIPGIVYTYLLPSDLQGAACLAAETTQ
jgi:hypothetical protein